MHPSRIHPKISRAHFIGIGGVNMSALAKLLLREGVQVSGSDASSSKRTEELAAKGAQITIGHTAEVFSSDTDTVIYSSAVPETNVERKAARERGIREITNFTFLAEWMGDQDVILITGTHGKSTTTAMAGLMAIEAGLEPTVIVGSDVPAFPEGNIYFGAGEKAIIEGDEYAYHFLEFQPWAVLVHNIEFDHPDIFSSIDAVIETFRKLLLRVKDSGIVVANKEDERVVHLIEEMRGALEEKGIRIAYYGYREDLPLQVPGRMNLSNATGAATLVEVLGGESTAIVRALEKFHGISRRFELISDTDGILVVSDYAHHPTAIRVTLEAARAFYPQRRIVACFQPHQRQRTAELFPEFVTAFDEADEIVLVEIFDVTGRESAQTKPISSKDLVQAIEKRSEGRKRSIKYASNPQEAKEILRADKKSGDVILVMGAGSIYSIAKEV